MDFNVVLQRTEYQAERTFGKLSLAWHGSSYVYETLEDKVRDQKVHGRTAIPVGRYEMVVNYSPRFKRDMPLLLDVPNFVGVRIHVGNTEHDTEGCILVGRARTASQLLYSRAAYDEMLKVLLEARMEKMRLFIDVRK